MVDIDPFVACLMEHPLVCSIGVILWLFSRVCQYVAVGDCVQLGIFSNRACFFRVLMLCIAHHLFILQLHIVNSLFLWSALVFYFLFQVVCYREPVLDAA